MTDYHTLPCGTKIPPEGIKCRVWDREKCAPAEATIIAYVRGLEYSYKAATASWRHYEIIKEPKQVPLSYETYHGEPLRRIGCVTAFYPYNWSELGVRLDPTDTSRKTWEGLMAKFEHFKDGEWQPCSVTEE